MSKLSWAGFQNATEPGGLQKEDFILNCHFRNDPIWTTYSPSYPFHFAMSLNPDPGDKYFNNALDLQDE